MRKPDLQISIMAKKLIIPPPSRLLAFANAEEH